LNGSRRRYFVTGTGTGVGKTFVSCALARRARELGARRVLAFKPIETGCSRHEGQLVGADQQLLCDAAGNWQAGALRGSYQFEPAVAPLVAAELSNQPIDLISVMTTLDDGLASADFAIVEGAGGWRVPITPSVDMSGLSAMIGFPVVVVAQATLGTINHSLLTIEAIERDQQQVAALVLSRRPEDPIEHVRDNAHRISCRWHGTVLIASAPADLEPLLPTFA
jgi:dethiobiotin synthetase